MKATQPAAPVLRSPWMLAIVAALALTAGAPGPARAATGAGAASTASLTAKALPHSALPFIEDDYTRAVAEARARKLPLFIEAWAPW